MGMTPAPKPSALAPLPEIPRKGVNFETITEREFMGLAQNEKIRLIEAATFVMIKVGYRFSRAALNYNRAKWGDKEGLGELTAIKASAEIEYDLMKHTISGLQSTLKAEREMLGLGSLGGMHD